MKPSPSGGLTPIKRRLVELAEVVAQDPPEAGYLHAVLCQLGLPRRRTDATEIERTSGNASLLISAGKLWDGHTWKRQPLPYGTRPRLALIHISTRAVLTKNPVVDVGRSTRDFLIRLSVDTNGREYALSGPRGAARSGGGPHGHGHPARHVPARPTSPLTKSAIVLAAT